MKNIEKLWLLAMSSFLAVSIADATLVYFTNGVSYPIKITIDCEGSGTRNANLTLQPGQQDGLRCETTINGITIMNTQSNDQVYPDGSVALIESAGPGTQMQHSLNQVYRTGLSIPATRDPRLQIRQFRVIEG